MARAGLPLGLGPKWAHDSQGTGPSQWDRNSLMLVEAAAGWPTPRVFDAEQRGDTLLSGTLSGAACFPRARTRTTPSSNGATSSEQTERLNPRFVAWLMGLPVGWTDTTTPLARTSFDAWVTESSRWLAHWLSVYSQSGGDQPELTRRRPRLGVGHDRHPVGAQDAIQEPE